MKLYIKTTRDKYELPVAVAESAKELAEMINTTENCVYSAISHKHKGWIRIEVEDESED